MRGRRSFCRTTTPLPPQPRATPGDTRPPLRDTTHSEPAHTPTHTRTHAQRSQPRDTETDRDRGPASKGHTPPHTRPTSKDLPTMEPQAKRVHRGARQTDRQTHHHTAESRTTERHTLHPASPHPSLRSSAPQSLQPPGRCSPGRGRVLDRSLRLTPVAARPHPACRPHTHQATMTAPSTRWRPRRPTAGLAARYVQLSADTSGCARFAGTLTPPCAALFYKPQPSFRITGNTAAAHLRQNPGASFPGEQTVRDNRGRSPANLASPICTAPYPAPRVSPPADSPTFATSTSRGTSSRAASATGCAHRSASTGKRGARRPHGPLGRQPRAVSCAHGLHARNRHAHPSPPWAPRQR